MKLLKILSKREKGDLFAMGFTLTLMLMVTLNNFTSLYQQFDPTKDNTNSFFLLIIGSFFLFNVVGNLYRAITTDTSIYSLVLPIVLLPGWKYCSFCEQNAPPRSFHCFTCNRCILKRHNHCLFLGTCAGLKNMRFYLLFIVHVWLGLLISNTINYNYYITFMHEIDIKHLFIFFMPLFAFALGMISLYELFVAFTNALSMILSLLLFFYLIMNLTMAQRNQTWHERAKQIKIYDIGWKQNLIETFGYNWLQAFINPFSLLKLPSDGITYKLNVNINNTSTTNNNINTTNNNNDNLYRRRDLLMNTTNII